MRAKDGLSLPGGRLAGWALVASVAACSSAGPGITYVINGPDASPVDAGPAVDPTPASSSCVGDPAACLSGSIDASAFRVPARSANASLYRLFPSGAETPLVTVPVARDGTWAFSSLGPAPWSHYFVQIAAQFGTTTPASVTARVGPLAPGAGRPTVVTIKPVQLQVLETRASSGAPNLVQWASARVFDPATAVEVKGDGDAGGASATIDLGGGAPPSPMPWGRAPDGSRAFFVSFLDPPPAPPTFTLATRFDSSPPSSWHLVADPPAFDGAITSPASGSTLAIGADLPVAWTPEPGADFELVNLFARSGGSAWAPFFTSPFPDAPDVASETIPGVNLAQPGDYLLDVAYAKVSCPVTADGCVYASTVSSLPVTVR